MGGTKRIAQETLMKLGFLMATAVSLLALAACGTSRSDADARKTQGPSESNAAPKVTICELMSVLEDQYAALAGTRNDNADRSTVALRAAAVTDAVTRLLSRDWSQTDPAVLQLALAWADVG